jgi:hypothetical protein
MDRSLRLRVFAVNFAQERTSSYGHARFLREAPFRLPSGSALFRFHGLQRVTLLVLIILRKG